MPEQRHNVVTESGVGATRDVCVYVCVCVSWGITWADLPVVPSGRGAGASSGSGGCWGVLLLAKRHIHRTVEMPAAYASSWFTGRFMDTEQCICYTQFVRCN
jgi:hypothetical protein